MPRSEEHTSELQSQSNLVCRLLLEKKKKHAPALVFAPPDMPIAYGPPQCLHRIILSQLTSARATLTTHHHLIPTVQSLSCTMHDRLRTLMILFTLDDISYSSNS